MSNKRKARRDSPYPIAFKAIHRMPVAYNKKQTSQIQQSSLSREVQVWSAHVPEGPPLGEPVDGSLTSIERAEVTPHRGIDEHRSRQCIEPEPLGNQDGLSPRHRIREKNVFECWMNGDDPSVCEDAEPAFLEQRQSFVQSPEVAIEPQTTPTVKGQNRKPSTITSTLRRFWSALTDTIDVFGDTWDASPATPGTRSSGNASSTSMPASTPSSPSPRTPKPGTNFSRPLADRSDSRRLSTKSDRSIIRDLSQLNNVTESPLSQTQLSHIVEEHDSGQRSTTDDQDSPRTALVGCQTIPQRTVIEHEACSSGILLGEAEGTIVDTIDGSNMGPIGSDLISTAPMPDVTEDCLSISTAASAASSLKKGAIAFEGSVGNRPEALHALGVAADEALCKEAKLSTSQDCDGQDNTAVSMRHVALCMQRLPARCIEKGSACHEEPSAPPDFSLNDPTPATTASDYNEYCFKPSLSGMWRTAFHKRNQTRAIREWTSTKRRLPPPASMLLSSITDELCEALMASVVFPLCDWPSLSQTLARCYLDLRRHERPALILLYDDIGLPLLVRRVEAEILTLEIESRRKESSRDRLGLVKEPNPAVVDVSTTLNPKTKDDIEALATESHTSVASHSGSSPNVGRCRGDEYGAKRDSCSYQGPEKETEKSSFVESDAETSELTINPPAANDEGNPFDVAKCPMSSVNECQAKGSPTAFKQPCESPTPSMPYLPSSIRNRQQSGSPDGDGASIWYSSTIRHAPRNLTISIDDKARSWSPQTAKSMATIGFATGQSVLSRVRDAVSPRQKGQMAEEVARQLVTREQGHGLETAGGGTSRNGRSAVASVNVTPPTFQIGARSARLRRRRRSSVVSHMSGGGFNVRLSHHNLLC